MESQIQVANSKVTRKSTAISLQKREKLKKCTKTKFFLIFEKFVQADLSHAHFELPLIGYNHHSLFLKETCCSHSSQQSDSGPTSAV